MTIDQHVALILFNISRRAQVLDDDIDANVLLESRLISGKLSEVKGLSKVLNHAKLKKAWYEQQEVPDPLSHHTVTRSSLHKQYSL